VPKPAPRDDEVLNRIYAASLVDGCCPSSKVPKTFWYFDKEHLMRKIIIALEYNDR
jgi:hypothetical protein